MFTMGDVWKVALYYPIKLSLFRLSNHVNSCDFGLLSNDVILEIINSISITSVKHSI